MANPYGKATEDAGYGKVINDANSDMDKPQAQSPDVSNENNERVASVAKAKKEGDAAMKQQQQPATNSNTDKDNPGQQVRLSILDRFMEQFRKSS